MKKEIALLVAAGCAATFAATNYDLLGRKGSKMNSPMVYKNVDYTKVKKNEQKEFNSPLENRSLKKAANPSGVHGGPLAISGGYNTRGFAFSKSGYPYCFSLTTYHSSGSPIQSNDAYLSAYMDLSNSVFISTNVVQNVTPSGAITSATASNVYGWSLTEQSGNPSNSVNFSNVESNAKRWNISSWFDAPGYTQCEECGDVGMYIDADAYPVRMDPAKVVNYYKYSSNDDIFPNHETEVLSSKSYSILQATTKNTSIYVTNRLPMYPLSKTPQIYVGLHNRKNPTSLDMDEAVLYGEAARDLDNYIYDNRTVEIAAAGNYWIRNNLAQLNPQAHAANAITVGAIDATNGTVASYTSNNSKYCTLGMGNCSNGNYEMQGSRKPEIYNYSHFYMGNDQKRTYTNWFTQEPVSYNRNYEYTESAAAYTANMVADLLRANPFYRWHPEVVKALMISSGDININQPYPHDQAPTTTKIPSYKSVVFNRFSYQANPYDQVFHESRYWIGDVTKLKTHTMNGRKEIRFSVKRPPEKTNFSAAIAWLSSGDDIAALGKIPQDFDLYVYEQNTPDLGAVTMGGYKIGSYSSTDAFEKISFTSSAEYLTFRITLFSDADASQNNGQVVLGFDLAGFN